MAKNTSTIKNRTVFTGDNLDIMRGMGDNTIDMIYLDPPFNSNANYAAPIGSEAAGAEFKDTWGLQDIDVAWHGEIAEKYPGLYELLSATRTIHGNSMMSYLIYMSVRIMEMRRILKDSGSIYLHCDPNASHYLKLMMDAVFGKSHFTNELIWSHQGSWIQPDTKYPRRHDTIFLYSPEGATFNILHEDNQEVQMNYKRWKNYIVDNKIFGKKMPSHDKRFATYLTRFEKEHGRLPNDEDVVLEILGSRIGTVQYVKVVDPKSKEATKYPTQKPLELLRRIIRTSSNKHDLILDPFCGCATTMVAAEIEDRHWIGIDISPLAIDLVVDRVKKHQGLFQDITSRGLPPRV